MNSQCVRYLDSLPALARLLVPVGFCILSVGRKRNGFDGSKGGARRRSSEQYGNDDAARSTQNETETVLILFSFTR